jgi:serine/threonine protein kinase
MATGRLPFTAASPAETVTNILEKDPTPVLTLEPKRSGQLGRIISKLLSKHVDGRYQTARELEEDLVKAQTRQSTGLIARLLGRIKP